MNWNRDLSSIPKDGRWVLILSEHGQPACVFWLVQFDDVPFGWSSDGGDRYDPAAWIAVADEHGKPIYP